MTSDRLQRSLFQLQCTADALERGRPRLAQIAVAPVPVPVAVAAGRPDAHSTRELIWSTVRHTVLSVAVVLAVGVTVDPVLPRPDGPHLAAAAEAPAIPQSAANRP